MPILQQKSKSYLETLVKRLIVIRNSLFEIVDKNSIIEYNSSIKRQNKYKEKNKIIFSQNEPKITFQASFKPQIYSQLKNENNSQNSSFISLNNSLEEKLSENPSKEKSKNFIHHSQAVENEFFSTINPEKFPKKKKFVTIKEIKNEISLLNEKYRKIKIVPIKQEEHFLPTIEKTKPLLPYGFLSQQLIKKSKSQLKLKPFYKSIQEESEQEALPEINKSVKIEFNVNKTVLYQKGDLMDMMKNQFEVNKEMRKLKKSRITNFSIV
jgi:hypothetical protein